MAVIRITQATNVTLGLPDRTKIITVSEVGQNDRSVYRNTTQPQRIANGSGAVPGTPFTEAVSMGSIHVDMQGVMMDDRDFAAFSPALRHQVAIMIEKTALVVEKDGVVQTATQIRTYT